MDASTHFNYALIPSSRPWLTAILKNPNVQAAYSALGQFKGISGARKEAERLTVEYFRAPYTGLLSFTTGGVGHSAYIHVSKVKTDYNKYLQEHTQWSEEFVKCGKLALLAMGGAAHPAPAPAPAPARGSAAQKRGHAASSDSTGSQAKIVKTEHAADVGGKSGGAGDLADN